MTTPVRRSRQRRAMADVEARSETHRRWGDNGVAKCWLGVAGAMVYCAGVWIVIVDDDGRVIGAGTRMVGCGKSWKEAFRRASIAGRRSH